MKLTTKQIEALAVKHEAFGHGFVDPKGYTTHGFDPKGLQSFVKELIELVQSDSLEAIVRNPPLGLRGVEHQYAVLVSVTSDGDISFRSTLTTYSPMALQFQSKWVRRLDTAVQALKKHLTS